MDGIRGNGPAQGVDVAPENYSWKCGECGHVGLAHTFPVDRSYWSDDGDVRCPECGSPNTDEAPESEWPRLTSRNDQECKKP